METLDQARMQAQVDELVSAKEKLHQYVLEGVRASCVGVRASARKGTLLNSGVGEYMMVVCVNKRGELNKLL